MANKDRDAVETSLNDLLGNVIQTDRRHSGRGKNNAAVTSALPISSSDQEAIVKLPEPTEDYDNKTITHYDNNALRQAPSSSSLPVAHSKIKAKAAPRKKRTQAEDHHPETDRVETAYDMAQTPTMTVTLRIPQAFNTWLDEYVHLSWPQKIKKQELVIEALRLLYARRGKAGEEITLTALLGETDE